MRFGKEIFLEPAGKKNLALYYLEAEESPPTQNRAGCYLATLPADYWFLGEIPTEAGEGIAEFDTYKTFGHV